MTEKQKVDLDLKTLNLPKGYKVVYEDLDVSNGVDNHWIVLYKGDQSIRMFSPVHSGPFGPVDDNHLGNLKWRIESAAWTEEQMDGER